MSIAANTGQAGASGLQEVTSPDVAALFQQGLRMAAGLDYPGAVTFYEQALRSLPPELDRDVIELRLEYAESCLVIGRWDRAHRELQRLQELHQGDPLPLDLSIRIQVDLGEFYAGRGELDEAKAAYQAGRALASASSHWLLVCLVRLASLAGQTGEMDDALQLLETADRHVLGQPAATSEGFELAAALEAQWGLYNFRLAKNRQAEQKFESALAIIGKAERVSLEQASIYRYLGVMASLRREHREALEHHLAALRIYLKAGCRYGQAKVYDSIGRTFLAANRLDEAVHTFKRSEQLCRRLGAQAELATLYGKLGQVSMLREDFEGAIRHFRRDLEMSSKFRNYYALGYSYRNLGRCLLQLGRYQEALTNLKESLGLFQYVDDSLNRARVHMDIGYAHAKANQLVEAEESSRRARSLFQEHGLARELAFLECLDGILHRERGEGEAAEQCFMHCIGALCGRGSEVWLAETYYELGMLFRGRNQTSQAVEAFQSAIRTARSAGLSRQVGRYLTELESLDEIELFQVWREDLPLHGESGEKGPG
jgi:tetratricopeptide (TPR) repeat protein